MIDPYEQNNTATSCALLLLTHNIQCYFFGRKLTAFFPLIFLDVHSKNPFTQQGKTERFLLCSIMGECEIKLPLSDQFSNKENLRNAFGNVYGNAGTHEVGWDALNWWANHTRNFMYETMRQFLPKTHPGPTDATTWAPFGARFLWQIKHKHIGFDSIVFVKNTPSTSSFPSPTATSNFRRIKRSGASKPSATSFPGLSSGTPRFCHFLYGPFVLHRSSGGS